MLAVVALILDLCMKKAKALNKMISRHSSFTKRRVVFIRKSKIKATIAIIQITRLLVKLECFEIILFNALAFLAVVALILDFRIKKAKALNKMISKHSSFTKRRVV
jgi:hypothetical protein